jgi:RHS repeat-associated protein
MKRHITVKELFSFTSGLSLALLFSGGVCRAQSPATLPAAYTGTTLNWVREWNTTAPETNPANLLIRPLTDVKQVTRYIDGFGRPMETVSKDASPAGNDMVTANCYDLATGNEIYKYLPFTSNVAATGDVTNDGNFKFDRFQQQAAYYNTYLSGQQNETNVGSGGTNWAYSQTGYEASPLLRVLTAYAPGANWVGSQSSSTPHSQQQEFLLNTATDSVQIWNIPGWSISNPELATSIIPANGGAYPAGELYKTISTNEQGLQTVEFKDMYGQVILRKVQMQSSSTSYAPFDNGTGSGHTGWLCTYFVYDDHGNLRFVVTPNVVTQLVVAGSWSISQVQADELCYRFEYDQLNHMIVKKTPGTPTGTQGEIWMIYDQRNRVVMKQDGNMRANKQWLYFEYDNLDRLIARGFINDPTYYNVLSYHVAQAAISSNTSAGVSAWPLSSYSSAELLAQVFYDNYTNIPSSLPQTLDNTTNGAGNASFTTSYNVTPTYAQPITQSLMTQGMITGTNTEVLGTSGGQYIPSVTFYDEKARVIQRQSINYTLGKDIFSTQFGWSGVPLTTLMSQNYGSASNPQTLVITSIAYDAMDRMDSVTKTVTSTVNGVAVTSAATRVSEEQFDESSRLLVKTLGPGSGLETLTYGYNVRGWPLDINQNYISGSSTNHYFGMELAYDKSSSVAPGNSYLYPIFNGDIAGTVWKSEGDGINRKYDLTYDNANRLAAGAYLQNTTASAWDKSFIDFSVSGITYDANGNITAMHQNGFAQGGSIPVDELSYNYVNGAGNSNRLIYVNDSANVTNSTLGDFHFPGSAKTSSSVDYTYDANANTVSDNNRSITSITYYSFPSLPNLITTSNGTIQFFYDAAGNKLKKVVTQTGVTINSVSTTISDTIKYVNGFIYKSLTYSASALSSLNYTGVLQYLGDEEGRLRFKPAVGSVPASFVHDYMIKDQLGNVRVGITDEQAQDIYPAATGETTSETVSGVTSDAQNYEAQYYSFKPSDFVASDSLGAWFNNMSGSSYTNENDGGTPVNNDPYSVVTAVSQRVLRLCGNIANNPTGDNYSLGITLKVMAGDVVNIYGLSFWNNSGNLPSGSYPVSAVLTSLLSAFGGSTAVTSTLSHSALDGSAFNASSSSTTYSLLYPMLNDSSAQSGTQAPYAGVNYIIFDDQFRPVTVGFDPVSTTTDNIKDHNLTVTIPKNGYIYVYASNQSNINVYFDNLQVILNHGAMLEETHYYPVGLAMAGISDRAWNKQPNYLHYQGNEMQDEEWYNGTGLEEYDFHARYYDPQIGRWNTQDPAGQYVSPYIGMGDNWMNGIDPNGESWLGNFLRAPWNDLKIIAGLFAYNNKQTFGGNIVDFFSRITWQAPQEAVGLTVMLVENTVGLVDKVGYFNGTTVANTSYLANDVGGILPGSAFTLGSYINGPSHMQLNPSDPTFQHEYGRYLQSQADGPAYLTYTAIPDLFSPGNGGPTARDANARALEYFNEYYGGLYSPTNPGGFTWDFYPSENPISGYQQGQSINSAANQAALKANIRTPGWGFVAASSVFWLPWSIDELLGYWLEDDVFH